MVLVLENISKSFHGNVVLKNLSLSFQEQETTVIVGPSGSGKSTLLRCMNLLEVAEVGTVRLDNLSIDFTRTIDKRTKQALRRNMGMVFQSFNLFSHLTAIENIIEGPVQVLKKEKQEVVAEAKELLDSVGLADKYDSYPSRLSGGQQQRVAIARALAMQPKYLLFDEPTSALDPELEMEVFRVLRQLSEENLSMILVTHNLDFARKIADRMIFLEHGAVQYDGSTEAFFQSEDARIQRFINSLKL